ncbi:hypothetical protein DENSPDRAFT_854821 [Dentipellis sp. KUC8613]|nr:hypothetical protein DENSPDRAFT_854821 [Dentipellis sp. KUC8613]
MFTVLNIRTLSNSQYATRTRGAEVYPFERYHKQSSLVPSKASSGAMRHKSLVGRPNSPYRRNSPRRDPLRLHDEGEVEYSAPTTTPVSTPPSSPPPLFRSPYLSPCSSPASSHASLPMSSRSPSPALDFYPPPLWRSASPASSRESTPPLSPRSEACSPLPTFPGKRNAYKDGHTSSPSRWYEDSSDEESGLRLDIVRPTPRHFDGQDLFARNFGQAQQAMQELQLAETLPNAPTCPHAPSLASRPLPAFLTTTATATDVPCSPPTTCATQDTRVPASPSSDIISPEPTDELAAAGEYRHIIAERDPAALPELADLGFLSNLGGATLQWFGLEEEGVRYADVPPALFQSPQPSFVDAKGEWTTGLDLELELGHGY